MRTPLHPSHGGKAPACAQPAVRKERSGGKAGERASCYGTGGNLDNAANALTSTANFLKAHGWRAGAGYQPGEANFAAIQAWNAAPVYQRAIAVIGQQIDGGEGTSARR
jgi:hypothetical protein